MRYLSTPWVLLTIAACAAPTAEDTGESEDQLTSFSLALDEDATTATDSPRLTAAAAGNLSCGDRFATGSGAEARVRYTCRRGAELLEITLRTQGKAIVLHRPAGRANDKRAFFSCTSSGARPSGVPAKLACTTATLTDRSGNGGLSSPFASTAPGIDIANAHVVGQGPLLLRGMAPRSAEDYDQLFASKVGAFLVFKNATGNGSDVSDELAELTRRGIPAARAKHIAFKWKDLTSYKESCEQTVEALAFLSANKAAHRKTYFHCTVGEDRTGLLAAMARLVDESNLDAAAAWDEEMCERGYGAGNPLKPSFVVKAVDGGLTPLYRKLAYLVKTGRLERTSLVPSACQTDPSTEPAFAEQAIPLARLTCGTSTRFEP